MGAILAELTDRQIDATRLRAFVGEKGLIGAVATFEGMTREEHDRAHGPLTHLHYEAYDEMARAMLAQLAAEARTRLDLNRVAVVHRIGIVPVGEPSVLIAVSSAHRAAAFDACRWLIDRLKQSVPIWKKDVFADGFARWVDPHPYESAPAIRTPSASDGPDPTVSSITDGLPAA